VEIEMRNIRQKAFERERKGAALPVTSREVSR